jgi:hypothetical protein
MKEKLEPGSYISGTQRPEDLLKRFLGLVNQHRPVVHQQLVVNNCLPSHIWEDDEAEWWDSIHCSNLIDELMCVLDEHCSDGYYFGSHPGDSADYGVWRYQDEHEE